jgi:L-asparaginase II
MSSVQQADQENRSVPVAEPLVEIKRGSITESRHRGHIVAVEPDGNIIASAGAFETVTFLRSSAKPFQAIPLLVSGAADRFGFNDREVAMACASHNGEPIHTEIVASMLRKIGLGIEALRCGVHEPYAEEAARELRERGESPNALHNNCSGKHAGMLAVALHLGASIDSYESPENPVQKVIADTVAQFCGVPVTDIAVGTDGCAAPIFGITIKAMALAYARLVSPPEGFDKITRGACERIARVMNAYPELIGGTSNRLDTEVMRAAPRRVISKVGAEGVYTAGVMPCKEWPNGLGIALKIEDGDDKRARPTVVVESLRQLGVLRDESLEAVAKYAFFPIRNRRGDLVGEISASFALKKPSGEVLSV